MTAEYINKIKKMIAEKAGVEIEEINDSTYFEDDLNVGEMELMEILTEIEDEIHVDVLEEKNNIETVGDLLDLVNEQIE